MTNFDVQKEYVESIYADYVNKKLLVNRKYQRKLVWTVEEKQKFIDSIFNQFPVPLFLLAVTKYKDKQVYEIIDGMQRIEALVAFIENRFKVNGKYFNLDTVGFTKLRKDSGKVKQRKPFFSIEESLTLTSYQLPITRLVKANEEIIEEVFRRLNSYGKRLSSHELRQAGSQSDFSYIIKSISEKIRGDVSPSDKILLGNMRKISINNINLGYGIKMKDVYWAKEKILTNGNIRASRDEELIAHLVGAMLTKNKLNISGNNLDRLYQVSDDDSLNINVGDLISRYGGPDFVIKQFEAIFQEINDILSVGGKNFRDVVFKKEKRYMNYAYHVLFMAFYKILVDEEKKVVDKQELYYKLNGIGDDLITPITDRIRYHKKRRDCINAVKGRLSPYFQKRNSTDPVLSNGVVKLEALLEASKVEGSAYDFKQGLYQLDNSGENIRLKVVKTLCSFVNMGPNSIGYVVVGVGDKEKIARRFNNFYGERYLKHSDFFVLGVDAEADKHFEDLDKYRTNLEQFIRGCDIEPTLYKTQIINNIDFFTYRERTIIIMKVEAGDQPVKLDGKYYQRSGTESLPIENEKEVWQLFLG